MLILWVAAITKSPVADRIAVEFGLIHVGATDLSLCGKLERRSLGETEPIVVLSGQIVGPLVIGERHYRLRPVPCCKVDALRELI